MPRFSSTASRTPLSNKSNIAGKRAKKRSRTSCVFAEPPAGCQFKTTFACKYYGQGTTTIDAEKPLSVKKCMNIVKQVIAKNQKRSAPATLCVTDRGIDFEDSSASVFHHVPIREMFKIVPGTIVSKSGKKCTVAIIIHYDESAELDQQPCHVFQCAHRQDAALMHEAGKRMWRDHLFSNLLDVSTEEGQDGFDSFMIRQDMETAATRCTELIQRDEIVTNDRCSMLIRSELDNFSPLTLLPGSL